MHVNWLFADCVPANLIVERQESLFAQTLAAQGSAVAVWRALLTLTFVLLQRFLDN